MKHCKHLAISFLHAWGVASGLMVLLMVVTAVTDALKGSAFAATAAQLLWITPIIFVGTFIYVGAAYLMVATPYYFGVMRKHPAISAVQHYLSTGTIAFSIIALIAALPPDGMGYGWLLLAAIASTTAIVGTHTLLRRTSGMHGRSTTMIPHPTSA